MTRDVSGKSRISGRIQTGLALLLVLVFGAWWRGHTFGPSVQEKTGWTLWPAARGASEPLDCDEAVYAYIGEHLSRGEVMYQDLTENKPPGGYWLYALAVAIGGPSELTVRFMPVPIVLLTMLLLFWIGNRVSGPAAGLVSAFVFSILCTDPYMQGNNANLEHSLNLFSVASLAAMTASWRGRRGWLVVSGAMVGCAALVKQVGAFVGPFYALAAWYRTEKPASESRFRAWFLDMLALASGFLIVWTVALGVVMGRGAGTDAWHDIVTLGSAIASAPAGPFQPPFLVRWVTGNADGNNGRLPWPFGEPDDWIIWWGTGSYPVWIMAIPGLLILLFAGSGGPRRLVVLWTLVAWVEVALPGMFWAHYYLLATPGVALAFGAGLVEALAWFARFWRERRLAPALAGGLLSLSFLAAGLGFVAIQVRDYLLVAPEALTGYKSGLQWVADRQVGRMLKYRAARLKNPTLYVWGWQSPLYFYSGMNCPIRHFFANDWVLYRAGKGVPLVDRFLDETIGDLKADPPDLIFLGLQPFPQLGDFITSHYVPTGLMSDGAFERLWVRRDKADLFESAR
jgi:4-amino-4-deoxy-L-arabinose transferase-like glycosyltransferase